MKKTTRPEAIRVDDTLLLDKKKKKKKKKRERERGKRVQEEKKGK